MPSEEAALRTVQVGIAGFQQRYAGNWHYILAASTAAALPMLVIPVCFQ
jgi:multiple sugar transport system permease protein